MTTPDAAQAHFLSRFGECEAQLAGTSPAWLAPIRRAAIERFAELGFPTRKNEAWKYTSVSEIATASPMLTVDNATRTHTGDGETADAVPSNKVDAVVEDHRIFPRIIPRPDKDLRKRCGGCGCRITNDGRRRRR